MLVGYSDHKNQILTHAPPMFTKNNRAYELSAAKHNSNKSTIWMFHHTI